MTTLKPKPPTNQPKNKELLEAYEQEAKLVLRELIDLDYAHLADKLNGIGVDISARGLENKISRGNFSAAFLLQCMHALNIETLRISNERIREKS